MKKSAPSACKRHAVHQPEAKKTERTKQKKRINEIKTI
jgi:hypothetical protein